MNPDEDPSAPPAPSATLTFEEARVLGCLLEKEITTPEQYPLTMNGLVSACNQRSNRDPVMELEAMTVEHAMDGLRRKRMAVMLSQAGARVPKYKQVFGEVYGGFDKGMIAVLCELLLRNVQTPGELRSRCERLHPFADLTAVEDAAGRLMHYGVEPLVTLLPPGGGRRVKAYAHLFCGPVSENAGPSAASPAAVEAPPPEDWKAKVEAELAALRAELAELRAFVEPLR